MTYGLLLHNYVHYIFFFPALLDSEPRTSHVSDIAIALNCIHFSFLLQLNFGTGSH